MDWMASKIENWPIDKLSEYENNAKLHPESQVEKIAASIVEFGFINPILVDSSGKIIAGHGRLLASKKLGLSEVPVIVIDHLTDTQRRALIIADNKLAESGWDEEKLSEELSKLSDDGFDLEIIGFSNDELDELLDDNIDKSNSEKDDYVPEIKENPVSVNGDV